MSFTTVRKAVIPAAGLGTRVRSVAGELPKELLLVAAKPLIVHTIEGLAGCGIRKIAVVISPAKQSIREFLLAEPSEFVVPQLDAHLKVLFRSCEFAFFIQPSPTGVADAVSRCRDFISEEPFALVMPDNVLLDGLHPITQLLPFFSRHGTDVVGALRLSADEASRFGNVGFLEVEPLPGEPELAMRVCHYSDKKKEPVSVVPGTRVLKSFGGGIYRPHYFDFIERCRPQARGEVDDVPVVQEMARGKGLLAVELAGKGFDVGNPEGYWAANLYAERKHLPRGRH